MAQPVKPNGAWIRRGKSGALVIITAVYDDGTCRVYTPYLGTYRVTKVSTIERDYRYEREAGGA